LKDLLKEADVFVESNPPKLMSDLGLSYADLEKVNPRLIMTSITPFGQEGPYKDYKAYDINITAAGGLSYRIGRPDEEVLNMPAYQGSYFPGVQAAAATMAALYARDVACRGKGQHVDISQVRCFATIFSVNMGRTVNRQERGERSGNRLQGTYPFMTTTVKDGYFHISTIEEKKHWRLFLRLIGDPEWGRDPKFEDFKSRFQHADELDALLATWLMSHTKAEFWKLCRENHIPWAPLNTIKELVEMEHEKERNFFIEFDHPRAGKQTYPAEPCKYSTIGWKIRRPAPLLGQNNEEIYCGRLGYTKPEILDLWRTGII
jgi:crotonobetainyl-CoA:carnitine CoA-transferase CaiB-like acyl-CoA transferase